jgi:hypothetical protein
LVGVVKVLFVLLNGEGGKYGDASRERASVDRGICQRFMTTICRSVVA